MLAMDRYALTLSIPVTDSESREAAMQRVGEEVSAALRKHCVLEAGKMALRLVEAMFGR
jgi:hypothetical protein